MYGSGVVSKSLMFIRISMKFRQFLRYYGGDIGKCIQKFPDWPPGARAANSTDLCH
jgi:hypothetical protein